MRDLAVVAWAGGKWVGAIGPWGFRKWRRDRVKWSELMVEGGEVRRGDYDKIKEENKTTNPAVSKVGGYCANLPLQGISPKLSKNSQRFS
ncbi:hypothetical protein KFK09_007862 [Dendrobium nobile]|uniref:Uncharacterized protein n=1 Tax=Dendrobium nobile TaxID=94219 RepID=A0A8T3BVA2_DENNO|nr:hypothetical protein KFK09_007862 [Dendrobium nobile]